MTAQRPETVIICDVSALAPDAGSVDALARLELLARRQGKQLRLRKVSSELQQLLGLCGLADILRVEAVGQPEEREERVGVEEERQLGDPPA
jgi:ABC-type transporter Mla MlaB component